MPTAGGDGADHPVHQQIYHCASVTDWVVAQAEGEYSISSRGRTLAQEGFVHAENLEGGPENLPHVYGPIPVDAVTSVVELERAADGWRWPGRQ